MVDRKCSSGGIDMTRLTENPILRTTSSLNLRTALRSSGVCSEAFLGMCSTLGA